MTNCLVDSNFQGGYNANTGNSGTGSGGFIWLRQDLGTGATTRQDFTATNCTFTNNQNLVNYTSPNIINHSKSSTSTAHHIDHSTHVAYGGGRGASFGDGRAEECRKQFRRDKRYARDRPVGFIFGNLTPQI